MQRSFSFFQATKKVWPNSRKINFCIFQPLGFLIFFQGTPSEWRRIMHFPNFSKHNSGAREFFWFFCVAKFSHCSTGPGQTRFWAPSEREKTRTLLKEQWHSSAWISWSQFETSTVSPVENIFRKTRIPWGDLEVFPKINLPPRYVFIHCITWSACTLLYMESQWWVNFQVVWSYSGAMQKVTQLRSISWHGNLTRLPSNEPVCGFSGHGDLCPAEGELLFGVANIWVLSATEILML